mgnify:CR=1 FL=1
MHPVRDPITGAVPVSAAGLEVRSVCDTHLLRDIASGMWSGVGSVPMARIPGVVAIKIPTGYAVGCR